MALVGTGRLYTSLLRIFSRVMSRTSPFRPKKEERAVSSSMAPPNRVRAPTLAPHTGGAASPQIEWFRSTVSFWSGASFCAWMALTALLSRSSTP